MAKRVLIVDDSALVRKQLTEIIGTLEYEIDFAKNGQEGVEKAIQTQYDIITMDINMPVMDGLEAVKKIMSRKPTAILMISSLTTEDADITMDALDAGAIDYIAKPGTMNIGKDENEEEIIRKVKYISRIPLRRLAGRAAHSRNKMRERKRPDTETTADVKVSSTEITKVVLIGSSTGGPGLIQQICQSLPKNYKFPICVVQHMPERFSEAFAQRLSRVSGIPVHESKNNMELLPGNVYIARGGVHMNFSKKASGKIVILENNEKGVNFFQPSVKDMMLSALETFGGSNLVGVMLSGIGDDGADAMVKIKAAGAYTLGESEESATVYGMPKEAYERGGVTEQLHFSQILKKITTLE